MLLPAYRASRNLGDAIQTVALKQFVPCTGYAVRDLWHQLTDFKAQAIINGYLCTLPPKIGANTRFAGVFLSKLNRNENLEWLKRTGKVIGTRDPYTSNLLTEHGIQNEMIGCVTCTLKPYHGPRKGHLRVDVDHPNQTNMIPASMSWQDQVRLAQVSLHTYREAESVETCRLHVAIPCLAFGTPVTIRPPINDPERFTLLDDFGVKFNIQTVMDMAPFRRRYLRFLERCIE